MGARLPSILYQPENLRSALGDQKTRIDWTSFNDRCVTVGNTVRDDITTHFSSILLGDRTYADNSYEPEVVLKIIRNDAEIRRMEAEAFKLRMEAYQGLIDLDRFTEKEERRMIVEGRTDFDDFPVDKPMDGAKPDDTPSETPAADATETPEEDEE